MLKFIGWLLNNYVFLRQASDKLQIFETFFLKKLQKLMNTSGFQPNAHKLKVSRVFGLVKVSCFFPPLELSVILSKFSIGFHLFKSLTTPLEVALNCISKLNSHNFDCLELKLTVSLLQLLQRHRTISKLNAKLQTNVDQSLDLNHKFFH